MVGIVLGDSVIKGFGSSPIYYNEQGPKFKRSAYRFVASADKPIRCLDGYEGIHKWLNRGVTANGTNATIGVAATGRYSFKARKTKPSPEMDDRSATLGIFRRKNSPKTHKVNRIMPVMKLLVRATYHASS